MPNCIFLLDFQQKIRNLQIREASRPTYWGGLGGRSPPREKGDDADGGGDGADAPRPNPPQLGPQAHPVQEKISRSGEPLTLIEFARKQ